MAASKKKKSISKKKPKVTKKATKKKVVKKKGAKVSRRKGTGSLKKKKRKPLELERSHKNPIIGPSSHSYWESEAVFNPGAVLQGGRVHLFYRALGPDGISRVGYASSKDGIHFDRRHPHPVYMPESVAESKKHHPYTSPARLSYDRALFASGGGWGGCEDPRAVAIDGKVYMTFNIFNGWHSIRVGLTSIDERDLEDQVWRWSPFVPLSPPGQRHKNWALFPEKINGKYALFHNLYHPDENRVQIALMDDLENPPKEFQSHDPQQLPDRIVSWHNRTRSIGPPPVKTKYGWLLFYHAMDKNDPGRYKLGVLLLDSKDPTKVLYRSQYPLLEPDEWYENDWKPGIIYASGAIVKGDTLFIYYGGGDKYIGVAYTDVDDFVKKLMRNEHATFKMKSTKVS